MVALTRNLDFFGSRFLTGLAAVFVAALRQAPAGQVRALGLVIRRHHLVLLNFYLRFIIQPINVPAVTPIANVAATVSTGCR